MNKKMMNSIRKIMAITICAAMIIGFGYNPDSKAKTQESEMQSIEKIVHRFFSLFENKDLNNKSFVIKNIKNLFVTKKNHTFEDYKEHGNSNSNKNLEFIDLLISRREILEEMNNLDYKEYDKRIEIDIKDSFVQDKEATINAIVKKTWHYGFAPETESGAVDNYDIEMEKEESEWKISKINGLEDTVFDEQINDMNGQISENDKNKYLKDLKYRIVHESETHVDELSTMIKNAKGLNSYNTSKAVKYAEKYALNPNPAYPDFSTYPGNNYDCTNFTSQCLRAGGVGDHDGEKGGGDCWFFKDEGNRSSTWAGAKEFGDYLNSNKSAIVTKKTDLKGMDYGDIIQIKYSGVVRHSVIVTGVVYSTEGKSDVLICCHSNNRKNVSLKDNFSNKKRNYYHIQGWKNKN